MNYSVTPVIASVVEKIRKEAPSAIAMADDLSSLARLLAEREQVPPESVLTGFFQSGLVFWDKKEHATGV